MKEDVLDQQPCVLQDPPRDQRDRLEEGKEPGELVGRERSQQEVSRGSSLRATRQAEIRLFGPHADKPRELFKSPESRENPRPNLGLDRAAGNS